MSLKSQIDLTKIPTHIAIIMDGNGRWAKGKGKFRIFGHQNGVNSVREVCESSAELGVKCLTLYAFSTENWSRPAIEVNALMELLVKTIKHEMPTLQKNKIKLHTMGQLERLPIKCSNALMEACEATKDNDHMDLVLALSYSSKWDIVNAVRKICERVTLGEIKPFEVDEMAINNHLSTAQWPHPELLIRTSGEHRVSNFLLWEIAYSEFYFTETLWPDFTREHLYEALLDYQSRERRFGKTSEQLVANEHEKN
ncbi:MAG: isoprenyl transferase [Bacteroidota bacterium]|nr:isoprenyl transferase [Bacteroidota bacterium]